MINLVCSRVRKPVCVSDRVCMRVCNFIMIKFDMLMEVVDYHL